MGADNIITIGQLRQRDEHLTRSFDDARVLLRGQEREPFHVVARPGNGRSPLALGIVIDQSERRNDGQHHHQRQPNSKTAGSQTVHGESPILILPATWRDSSKSVGEMQHS